MPWGGYTAVLEAALSADRSALLDNQPPLAPCKLCVKTYRPPVLVGGRYLKLLRGVAQTRWSVPGQQADPNESSVEVRRLLCLRHLNGILVVLHAVLLREAAPVLAQSHELVLGEASHLASWLSSHSPRWDWRMATAAAEQANGGPKHQMSYVSRL